MNVFCKKLLCETLITLNLDTFFRYLNRNKVLVVMYHGVTQNNYSPPIWTQLPVETFNKQIEFLASHYNIVTLSDFISSITSCRELPKRSALITFDDGLRNNYAVAFPILQKYSAPATIFLTMDFVGTDNVLWFDELLFLLKDGIKVGILKDDEGLFKTGTIDRPNLWNLYFDAVEEMKRMSEIKRQEIMDRLRNQIDSDMHSRLEDFGILDTKQIVEMAESGLIEFGSHTATHRILSNMNESEYKEELFSSKENLTKIMNKAVNSFCYPNGQPEIDFSEEHIAYLKKCRYQCAFTTKSQLYSPKTGDPFMIGRIPAGNDFTSYFPYFKLMSSGM